MEAATFNSQQLIRDYIWERYQKEPEVLEKAAKKTLTSIQNFKERCLTEPDIDYDFINKTLFFCDEKSSSLQKAPQTAKAIRDYIIYQIGQFAEKISDSCESAERVHNYYLQKVLKESGFNRCETFVNHHSTAFHGHTFEKKLDQMKKGALKNPELAKPKQDLEAKMSLYPSEKTKELFDEFIIDGIPFAIFHSTSATELAFDLPKHTVIILGSLESRVNLRIKAASIFVLDDLSSEEGDAIIESRYKTFIYNYKDSLTMNFKVTHSTALLATPNGPAFSSYIKKKLKKCIDNSNCMGIAQHIFQLASYYLAHNLDVAEEFLQKLKVQLEDKYIHEELSFTTFISNSALGKTLTKMLLSMPYENEIHFQESKPEL